MLFKERRMLFKEITSKKKKKRYLEKKKLFQTKQ